MDTNKLRNHVFEQTGIRIDTSDPVFALVALNDSVLAEGVERQRELIAEMADLLAARTKVLLDAGDRYQQQLIEGQQTGNAGAGRKRLIRQLLLGASVAVLAATLTLAGQALLEAQRPAPQAPLPTAAPAPLPAPLTTDQIVNMRVGEKFLKILPKLDAQAQTQVKELMDAP